MSAYVLRASYFFIDRKDGIAHSVDRFEAETIAEAIAQAKAHQPASPKLAVEGLVLSTEAGQVLWTFRRGNPVERGVDGSPFTGL